MLAAVVALTACERPGEPPQSQGQPSVRDTGTTPATGPIGQRRPDFTLSDLRGNPRSVSEWDGKVLVINFWATWCPPCRREMPAFVELQEAYGARGLQFLGIAIDEREKVQNFADTYGVNYPILIGELDAIKVSKRYGNRFGALPYTVIVNREGKIVLVQRGELPRDLAEETIRPLL